MCRFFFSFFVSVFLFSNSVWAVTESDIRSFFKNDYGNFLDFHGIKLKRTNDIKSVFKATYQRKEVSDPWREGIKHYLGDPPLFLDHKLTYRVLDVLEKKKTVPKELRIYEAEERQGELRVTHTKYKFAFGAFNEHGDFVIRPTDYGRLDLGFWTKVVYDPWQDILFMKERNIDPDRERVVRTRSVNAESFDFRFLNDKPSQKRQGTMKVVHIPGFQIATVLFMYDELAVPVNAEVEAHVDWGDETISFEVDFQYEKNVLSIDPSGTVEFRMTYPEFVKRSQK